MIRIILRWTSGVCYSSSGVVTPTEAKFELGMDFYRCQIRFPHEFSIKITKAAYLRVD